MLQKKYIRVFLYVYAGVFPLFLFLSLELLNPVSSGGLFLNVWQNIGAFTFSVVLLFLLALLLYSFIGSVFASYSIVTSFFLFAYTINHFKLQIAGGIFVPSDLRLVGAALEMMNRDIVVIELTFILCVTLIVFLLVPLSFCRVKIDFHKRIFALPIVGVVFLLIHFTLGTFGFFDGRAFDRYRDNGFILGFYSEIISRETNDFFSITPQEISQSFTLPTKYTLDEYNSSPSPTNPNVIVIMSEAFFDPTVLPNISFSQNPVPNFHRLTENHLSGSLVVPTFGGGTANTEFEFLGGSPHVFFGTRWYVPFENSFRYFYTDITTTLPWMFRLGGYRTVGVHTFWGDFFNRNRIYPRIGFDTFISADDMPDAVYKGDFISDKYFTDRIIEQILLAEQVSDPLFLFGISMQNHWPYLESRYDSMVLDVFSESPYLNSEEIGIMNTFIQGIFDADKQLGRLIEFVENRETPTIVVFFGDHLPIMGTHDHRIFEKLGFLSTQDEWEWNLQDLQNAYKSHYMVWANFELGLECFGTISAFVLGALVAEASGIELNRYFTYLLGAARSIRVLSNELFLTARGELEYGSLGRHNTDVQILESLWHYKMFGRCEFSQSLRELLPRL